MVEQEPTTGEPEIMSDDHVSGGEFSRWMNHLDGRFDKLDESQKETGAALIALDKRVSALEQNQQKAGTLSAKVSGAVAAIVAAVIQGIGVALGVK